MQIDLFLTPVPLAKANLEHKTVAVVDVLRSATSICAALLSGARGIIPTDGPGEAGEMRMKIGSEMTVMAGERDGVRMDSFTFGNSPAEFTREGVEGKFVIMTTTNGTAIFDKVSKASRVFSCGLVNVSKVAERVAAEKLDVTIVCSGQEGSFSIEDTLCGGMLIHLLETAHRQRVTVNDAASLALLLYRTNKTALRQTIQQGEHGRFLTSIGFAGDVELAAAVDSIPIVPQLKEGRLVADEH
ncbi:MAG: 2-phosphosulfolactate phosphatase [Candidatus Zixiibacteriota bacterium]